MIGCKIIHDNVIKVIIFINFLNLKTVYGKSKHTKEDWKVRFNITKRKMEQETSSIISGRKE